MQRKGAVVHGGQASPVMVVARWSSGLLSGGVLFARAAGPVAGRPAGARPWARRAAGRRERRRGPRAGPAHARPSRPSGHGPQPTIPAVAAGHLPARRPCRVPYRRSVEGRDSVTPPGAPLAPPSGCTGSQRRTERDGPGRPPVLWRTGWRVPFPMDPHLRPLWDPDGRPIPARPGISASTPRSRLHQPGAGPRAGGRPGQAVPAAALRAWRGRAGRARPGPRAGLA